MFNSSDVQAVFSGAVAEKWEEKSVYINSLEGNDNLIIPVIKKYITPKSRILEVGCGTGKLLSEIDLLSTGITLTGVEMSSDMIQQINPESFKNVVHLIHSSIENFSSNEIYDIIIMKQVLHHVVSRKSVLAKLSSYLAPKGVIIIMTPNEGYQRSVLPFDEKGDLFGRITDSMIHEYIRELPLRIHEIQHVTTVAKFSSVYEYFMFLYSIGSLQKVYNYKPEYKYALKLIGTFKNVLDRPQVFPVDFDYSYITLQKS